MTYYYIYDSDTKLLTGFVLDTPPEGDNHTTVAPPILNEYGFPEFPEPNYFYFIDNEWKEIPPQETGPIKPSFSKLYFYPTYAEVMWCALAFAMKTSGYKTKPKSKDITILIPCWGKTRYVERAIKSCVSQTLQPYEIIVLLMDDESRALKNHITTLASNIYCIDHERMDACKARNYLVNLCRTEYFVFLDADDILSDNALYECYKQPESIVYLLSPNIGDNEWYTPDPDYFHRVMCGNLTGLYHKEAWNELGGLDETQNGMGGEDFDFKLRLFEQGKWNVGTSQRACYYWEPDAENSVQKMNGHIEMLYIMWMKHKDYIMSSYQGYRISNSLYCSTQEIARLASKIGTEVTDLRTPVEVLEPLDARPNTTIQFNFGGVCDKNCEYCIDAHGKNSPERKAYGSVSKMLSILSKVDVPHAICISGGEPSLYPPELIQSILDALDDYPRIYVNSSGSNRNSLWHQSNKCIIIYHITNWNDRTVLDLKKNEMPRVVLTHKNVRNIAGLMVANPHTMIECSLYRGTDTNLLLTDDDLDFIGKIRDMHVDRMIIRGDCLGYNINVDLCYGWVDQCCTCTVGDQVRSIDDFTTEMPDWRICGQCQQNLRSRLAGRSQYGTGNRPCTVALY